MNSNVKAKTFPKSSLRDILFVPLLKIDVPVVCSETCLEQEEVETTLEVSQNTIEDSGVIAPIENDPRNQVHENIQELLPGKEIVFPIVIEALEEVPQEIKTPELPNFQRSSFSLRSSLSRTGRFLGSEKAFFILFAVLGLTFASLSKNTSELILIIVTICLTGSFIFLKSRITRFSFLQSTALIGLIFASLKQILQMLDIEFPVFKDEVQHEGLKNPIQAIGN